MNERIGNDLCSDIITQAINEMKEALGEAISMENIVFCKCKFPKVASKNGENCISILEKVAGCAA